MAVPQQSYLQTKPFRNLLMDETQNQIPTPITFIGPASFTDHPQYVPSYHFMGPPVGQVHAGAEGADQQQQQLWGRNAREKELFENSQISSIDFLQHQGSVSTGLGLALDDRKLASSGDSPPMPLGFFEHEVSIELQRQEAEIDRFLKIQGERLRQAVVEKVQAQHLSILSLIEEQMLRKLQEQEAKVDELNLKNADLEERMKQLNIEAAAWQHHAKCNESMITTLKYNIQQVYAQSKECKEGCGDSEVNDAASRCDGGPEDMHILISKENKDLKEHMNCKVCRVNKEDVISIWHIFHLGWVSQHLKLMKGKFDDELRTGSKVSHHKRIKELLEETTLILLPGIYSDPKD